MLWVKIDDKAHQVISYNLHWLGKDKYQVWVERPTGKGLMIAEGSKEEMKLLIDALDYTVERDEKMLVL